MAAGATPAKPQLVRLLQNQSPNTTVVAYTRPGRTFVSAGEDRTEGERSMEVRRRFGDGETTEPRLRSLCGAGAPDADAATAATAATAAVAAASAVEPTAAARLSLAEISCRDLCSTMCA